MEINKWDTEWIEQKAELEARLKAVFGCSSFALTLEASIAGHGDPADPSKPQGNLLEETPYSKHPLLTVLYLEMGKIAPHASHNIHLNILLRIAIYFIAKVGISSSSQSTRAKSWLNLGLLAARIAGEFRSRGYGR